MLTTDERIAYIATIRSLPDDLEALIDGLSAEQLTTAYLEGEWTVAQVVHHLVEMHTNAYLRLKAILTADRPEMQILDQDALAKLPAAQASEVGPSLMILRGLHHRWVQTWQAMGGEQWARIGLIRGGEKDITPDYLLRGYANHCTNHLQQVKAILSASQ